MIFIAWMVWAPFSESDQMIVMHTMVSPVLLLHWLLNSDGCALTLLEKKIRGLEHDDESFIHSVVGPVYNIDDAVVKRVVFFVTCVLWMVSLGKLSKERIRRVFTKSTKLE